MLPERNNDNVFQFVLKCITGHSYSLHAQTHSWQAHCASELQVLIPDLGNEANPEWGELYARIKGPLFSAMTHQKDKLEGKGIFWTLSKDICEFTPVLPSGPYYNLWPQVCCPLHPCKPAQPYLQSLGHQF